MCCHYLKAASGWGNKCVKLVKAVLDEKWNLVKAIAEEYSQVPWVARALRGKGQHDYRKGGGSHHDEPSDHAAAWADSCALSDAGGL